MKKKLRDPASKVITIDEYKRVLKSIEIKCSYDGKRSNDEGKKYSKNFWAYYNEKQFCINHMNLVDVKSVLDIGAGVGLLGVLLNYWYGIEVEATDVEDEKGSSGYKNMYKKIFKHMKTPRHICEIKNGKPIKLPKKYDMITMTRTVFDREELEGGYDNKYPHEKFDYEYFLNDIFQYCNRIFWKTNWQAIANKKVFPKSIHPFLWWPTKNRGSSDYIEDWLGRGDAGDIRNPNPSPKLPNNSMAKPYRAWYIILDKTEWENR